MINTLPEGLYVNLWNSEFSSSELVLSFIYCNLVAPVNILGPTNLTWLFLLHCASRD